MDFIPTSGKPYSVEVEGEKLYVSNWNGTGVQVFDLLTKTLLFGINSSVPADVSIDNSGRIFLTEHIEGKVKIYDNLGSYISSFNIPKTLDGKSVNQLNGIAIDDRGFVYVTDFGNNRVLKLDTTGNIISNLKVPEHYGGKFSNPSNVEIDPMHNVFVTDSSQHIFVFDSSDNFLYAIGEKGDVFFQFLGPHGISFNDSGNIYIAEWKNRISVFTNYDDSSNSTKKLN